MAGWPGWKPRTWRRRIWITGTAATLAALGILIGLLVAPSGSPLAQPSGSTLAQRSFPQPTGLFAVLDAATAVTLGWNAYAGGSEPDQFEILEDGQKIATVPGNQANYDVTGLSTGTSYLFSVTAVIGGSRSQPSAPVTAVTGSGPVTSPDQVQVAEAAFNWTGMAYVTETYGSDDFFELVGTSRDESWSVDSNCGGEPCDATLNGSIDGVRFTIALVRSGATYTGSATVDDYFDACGDSSQADYQEATVSIQLTANRARMVHGQWSVTAFAGTVAWDVPAALGGCPSSDYQMQVQDDGGS
jgi:hypothetical protein